MFGELVQRLFKQSVDARPRADGPVVTVAADDCEDSSAECVPRHSGRFVGGDSEPSSCSNAGCAAKWKRFVWLLGTLGVCVVVFDVLLLAYVQRVTNVANLVQQDQRWLHSDYVQQEMRHIARIVVRDELVLMAGSAAATKEEGAAADGRDDDGSYGFDDGSPAYPNPPESGSHYTTSAATASSGQHEEPNGGGRQERKMSHLQNIMRERREASLAMDNLLRFPAPATVEAEDKDVKYVEIFNPKIRRELEKRDEEFKKAHGYKGAAPGGDEWVWLTSYCRIPYESITGFCSSTKDYCPAGPVGSQGTPGPKGYRGDIGMPGPPGREGAAGARGPKGMPGSPGLDGRDGVPGEPGLDGVPGRAGSDGIPGKDGKDGMPGTDGQNGQNGRDGKEGKEGLQGPPGTPGERGLTGPKGRIGRPGNNGKNGDNGVCVYGTLVNGSISKELMIPPSIAVNASVDFSRPIIVQEGRHLRLRCPATGFPKPHVEWRRLDSQTTRNGAYEETSLSGSTLNITNINRRHMGAYQCIADNGIPPTASVIFNVEVQFAPLIRVRYQHLYAAEGNSVTLECEVEGYPEPVKYWKRRTDNRVLDQNEKFQMEIQTDGYKSKMQLNITRMRPEDYGEYHCVSKNELNTTTGILFVNDRSTPPKRGFHTEVLFGPPSPPSETYEDICGPPTKCPDCADANKEIKCKDGLPLYDLVGHLEVKPSDPYVKYPGLPNRTFDCVLYAVGKPVYHNFVDQDFGSWMRDPQPRNDDVGERYWSTNESDHLHLFEYANKVNFRSNISKMYKLPSPGFVGNAHIVYNGSFYYQEMHSNRVRRFDLDSLKSESTVIPYATFEGPNYLYTSKYNYMDFSVDDNGLWVIYSTPFSNNTNVAKLDTPALQIQYSWNISINHHKVGEMFIVCGVLYAVDSVTERMTKIRFALDLYRSELLDEVNLSFTNPFRRTTTVGYNHRSKELYTWDRGNQLTYPTRYHAVGTNLTAGDRNDDSPYSERLLSIDIS